VNGSGMIQLKQQDQQRKGNLNAGTNVGTTLPILLFMDAHEIGGTIFYTVNLAIELTRLGRSVIVVVPEIDGFTADRGQREIMTGLLERMRSAGVRVHEAERWRSSLPKRVATFARLIPLIRSYPGCIAVLVMGSHRGGARWTFAARLARARSVVRIELQPPGLTNWLDIWATRIKALPIDHTVVGCEMNRNVLHTVMGRDPAHISVVHTGIDLTGYVPQMGRDDARREMGLKPEDIAVGVVARLSGERKGVGFFLRSAAAAAEADPRLMFVVVGDGHARSTFEQDAESLGLAGRVHFAGWRSDIVRTLAAFDILVMPSAFEGGPTVVIEAMAMGLPVIATRVGMVPEIIDHGRNGLVCEYGADAELTRLIRRLAGDVEGRQRLGKAARDRALGDLGLRTMAERYLEVFDSLA